MHISSFKTHEKFLCLTSHFVILKSLSTQCLCSRKCLCEENDLETISGSFLLLHSVSAFRPWERARIPRRTTVLNSGKRGGGWPKRLSSTSHGDDMGRTLALPPFFFYPLLKSFLGSASIFPTLLQLSNSTLKHSGRVSSPHICDSHLGGY